MLPPGLDNKSTHQYGRLTLQINYIRFANIQPLRIEPHFFGMQKTISQNILDSTPTSIDYGIVTNLWHFYAYLNDLRTITLKLYDQENIPYLSTVEINLMPSSLVLNGGNKNIDYLFQGNSYLLNHKQTVSALNSKFSSVGTLEAELKISFDEDIHQTLFSRNLIDFEDILVIDEISPICSTIELDMMLPIQQDAPIATKINQTIRQYVPKEAPEYDAIKPYFDKQPKSNKLSIHKDEGLEADERMMEDDIDKLIAEMQNKPYDSSRYLENGQPSSNENINHVNSLAYTGLLRPHSRQKYLSDRKNSNEKLPPRLPPIMRYAGSTSPNHYHASPNSKLAHTISNPMQIHQNTRILSSINASPMRSINSAFTQRNNSQQKVISQPKIGIINLKVHELTMQKLQPHLSLILKIYLNQDNDQLYTVNGITQGQTISFNSQLKIDQRREIKYIRFHLIDSFDLKAVFATGIFEMNRLLSQNPTKGTFMVNLTSQPIQQHSSKFINVEQSQLVKIVPNIKNLRIEMEYQQRLQIVQIYLSLSDFNNLCRRCCYKIPLTKEKIQFHTSQLSNNKHINIFPHNRASTNKCFENIIVQLWGQSQLIGFTEVSLKPLSNTNQQIINSSLEPIYLYDEAREVMDMKIGKAKGKFHLKLCYGSVGQIQSLLNRDSSRVTKVEMPKKPIEVENHFGIYIKQNKYQKQVEIQVNSQQMELNRKLSKKQSMALQQQEQLPDQDEQDVTNQFISQSMQNKPELAKQTKILIKQSNLNGVGVGVGVSSLGFGVGEELSLDHSQTIKARSTLKSLTKQFQLNIKEALSDFENQSVFNQLKESCKEHLLYNFIEAHMLASVLSNLGVSETKMEYLLNQVIPVTNEMVNVNILYDMIFAMILEGEIKEKFIDDCQVGRYCLFQLYRNMKGQEDSIQFIFDGDTQFSEAKKVYQVIGYRITMRQFNLIEAYLDKSSSLQNSAKMVKTRIFGEINFKTKRQEKKVTYEKQIVSKIYKPQWDEDDDFFISNINQVGSHSTSNASMTQILPQPTSQRQITNGMNKLCFQQIPKVSIPILPQNVGSHGKQAYTLTVEGYEQCIQTIQCLMNMPLKESELKITYQFEEKNHEVKISRVVGKKIYAIPLPLKKIQFIDGSIELLDKEKCIAKCNLSIMTNMKSCYSLKNVQTLQFCGILKLLLQA